MYIYIYIYVTIQSNPIGKQDCNVCVYNLLEYEDLKYDIQNTVHNSPQALTYIYIHVYTISRIKRYTLLFGFFFLVKRHFPLL